MTAPSHIGSTVLDTGKTPGQWVDLLAERGIAISERTLRQKANRTGACYKLGGAMILTPEHIDTIFMEGQPCRLKTIAGGMSGGSKAASNTTEPRSPVTTVAALAHLTKLARGNGSSQKPTASGVVTSLARKRPSHSGTL